MLHSTLTQLIDDTVLGQDTNTAEQLYKFAEMPSTIDSVFITNTIKFIEENQASSCWDTSVILATTTVAISVVALIISILTMRRNATFNRETLDETVKHNALSVKPILNIMFKHDTMDLKIDLINSGLGPAMIKNVTFSHSEHNCSNMGDLYYKLKQQHIFLNLIKPITAVASCIDDYSLGEKDEIIIIGTSLPEVQRKYKTRFTRLLGEIKVKIDYTDIYGNKFILDEIIGT